jgi:hypothetical protein
MAPSELPFRIEGRRIWVAGHRGMVGSALMRRLARVMRDGLWARLWMPC